MSQKYTVLARKYRPQTFKEVVGQDVAVTTLKNALKHNRKAQAYLFCGPRGTGKTTLARLFAKVLNCPHLNDDFEPCNSCTSCDEIARSGSLTVLEIDGASNRGIDDIRQINETVGYSPSGGKEKVYIIDEVHMLTKEAFNALLKTLEEPPPHVTFLFATTEPHKVPPTILSRCQRFNLNRIPQEQIAAKLSTIAADLSITIDDSALQMIAQRAEGGLRDAESLLDQIHAFHDGDISVDDVADAIGVMPRSCLFALADAGKEGKYAVAFDIADQLFRQGKDYTHFVDMLIDHFRNVLLLKVGGKPRTWDSNEANEYARISDLYSREQCMTLLDNLIEMQGKLRLLPSPRIAIEALLLQIIRSHKKIPVELLVRKLVALEQTLAQGSTAPPAVTEEQTEALSPTRQKKRPLPKVETAAPTATATIAEDPTPQPQELPAAAAPPNPERTSVAAPQSQSHYDTLVQFAAVELNGTLQKHKTKIFSKNHKGT